MRLCQGRRTCMNVSVLFHVRFLMEPLATVLARVGPGVGVDQEVCRQGGASLEGFATLFARENPLVAMHSPGIRDVLIFSISSGKQTVFSWSKISIQNCIWYFLKPSLH